MTRVAMFVVAAVLAAQARPAAANAIWDFNVYLDDRRIGTHRFEIRGQVGNEEVKSVADFDVKILFFHAYRYRHQKTETWRNGCLATLESATNDNGRKHRIRLGAGASETRIEVDGATRTLPACVRSFAYWDRERLTDGRLINPQTGDYLPVELTARGKGEVRVHGTALAAQHYVLSGEKLQIDLWYADDGRWLGLESAAPGGRRLRYLLD